VRVSCSLALHNANGLHETSTDWIFRPLFVSLKRDTISHNHFERIFAMALAAGIWKTEGVSPELAATPGLSNKAIRAPCGAVGRRRIAMVQAASTNSFRAAWWI
jgi:hypothetical protein